MIYRSRLLIASTAATSLALLAPYAAAQQASIYDAGAPQADAAPVQPPIAPDQPAATVGQAGPAVGPPTALTQPLAPPGFPLSEVEQQFVMQTLKMWEAKSTEIKTFNAQFDRLEFNAVFGGGGFDKPLIQSTGTLSYSRPDKGSFKIDKISRWVKKNPQDTAEDAPGEWTPQPQEIGEHWVCDGKAVYEYNHRDKQLVVTPIPENMRGTAIADGPLPFLFGAEANKLVERYWIRTKESTPDQIWLEAYPIRQTDALNYDSVEVMLDRKTMQPTAIQVHLPGGQQRDVYMFKEPKVNGTNLSALFGGLFNAPRTPLGWTRVISDATGGPQAAIPQGVPR